nr:MAG TPA: hypothetical protein [Caudoviricetes sp.]
MAKDNGFLGLCPSFFCIYVSPSRAMLCPYQETCFR